MANRKLQVGVIGAGAAGLCAARHILAQPAVFAAPVVFESSDRIGGTWVYNEKTGTSDDGLPIHSSMYRALKTNLPKEIMAYPDYPFPPNLPSFLHHSQVLAYLESYADRFKVKEHIQFHTMVEQVMPISKLEGENDGTRAWEVTVRYVGDRGGSVTHRFDAIMVCNGHYFDPFIPELPGVEKFEGLILHSHAYRCPEQFTDKTVVVLGAGPSGIDIALEICTVAKQVILSHRKTLLECPLPTNLRQAPSVQGFSPISVHFQDGSLQQADAFIFCTGYNYRFPFLMHQTGLQAGGVSLAPLYKHLIHPELPNLFFIGLCTGDFPCILFDCQVQYCLAVLAGSCHLPSQEVMAAEVDKEYQCYLATGKPPKNFVKLDSLQEGYCHLLAEVARFKPVPPVIFQVGEATDKFRAADLVNYKSINLHLLSDEEWELV
ncbi:uncharacterized protein LOC144799878 [Lissotriton helveticus]